MSPSAFFGEKPQEFKKGLDDSVTEAYNRAGVDVYYDPAGMAEFVEAFSPAQPTFDGVALLQPDAKSVIDIGTDIHVRRSRARIRLGDRDGDGSSATATTWWFTPRPESKPST